MYVRAAHGRDEALAVITVLEGGNPYVPAHVLEEMSQPYAHTLDLEVLLFEPGELQPSRTIGIVLMTDRGAQDAWDRYLMPPVMPDRRPPFLPSDILAIRREGRGALAWAYGPEPSPEDAADGSRPTIYAMIRTSHLDYETTLQAVTRVFAEPDCTDAPEPRYRLVMVEDPWTTERATAWVLRRIFTVAAHDARTRPEFLALRGNADQIERDMLLPAEMSAQETRYVRRLALGTLPDEELEQCWEGVPRMPGRPRAPEAIMVDRILRSRLDRYFYEQIEDPEAEIMLLELIRQDALLLGLDVDRALEWYTRMAEVDAEAALGA